MLVVLEKPLTEIIPTDKLRWKTKTKDDLNPNLLCQPVITEGLTMAYDGGIEWIVDCPDENTIHNPCNIYYFYPSCTPTSTQENVFSGYS